MTGEKALGAETAFVSGVRLARRGVGAALTSAAAAGAAAGTRMAGGTGDGFRVVLTEVDPSDSATGDNRGGACERSAKQVAAEAAAASALSVACSDDVIMRGGESGEFSSEQLRIESGDSPDARRAARGLTVAEESGVSGTGGMVAAADDVAAFPEAGAVVVRLRSANKMPPAAATATLIAAVVVPSRVAMGGRAAMSSFAIVGCCRCAFQ